MSPAPSPGPEFPHCRAVLPSRWVSWACQTSSGEGARHVTPARECWEEAELRGLPFSHPVVTQQSLQVQHPPWGRTDGRAHAALTSGGHGHSVQVQVAPKAGTLSTNKQPEA